MLGLALEGGGAKGSYEIGAYIALKKLGYRFDGVAGTSIGSMNAALIAQGNIKLAKKLWLTADSDIVGINKEIVNISKNFKITKENIKTSISEINKLIKNKGLDISNYQKIIEKNIDEEKIRNGKMNYGLVTIRLKDLKPLELTIKDIPKGKLPEYIMASSYLPVFKMNKIIDDKYYIDGGMANNLPISILEKMGCTEVIAIKIDGVGYNKKNIYKTTKIKVVSPTKPTGPVILFNNEDIVNNYYMGYYDTLLEFNKLDGFKYYFKKNNNYEYISRNVNKKELNLIKLKYKTPDIKDAILKSIEEILEENNIYYYKIYKVSKIIKMIKKNNLKCKYELVNNFVYNLK